MENQVNQSTESINQSLTPNPVWNRNKRRQAWTCLIFALVSGSCLLWAGIFHDSAAERLDKMANFLWVFYGGLFSVILSYMGASVASTFAIQGRKR